MKKTKDQHLLPGAVSDVVEKLLSREKIPESVRTSYLMRVEAIVDYCSAALDEHDKHGAKPGRATEAQWARAFKKSEETR